MARKEQTNLGTPSNKQINNMAHLTEVNNKLYHVSRELLNKWGPMGLKSRW